MLYHIFDVSARYNIFASNGLTRVHGITKVNQCFYIESAFILANFGSGDLKNYTNCPCEQKHLISKSQMIWPLPPALKVVDEMLEFKHTSKHINREPRQFVQSSGTFLIRPGCSTRGLADKIKLPDDCFVRPGSHTQLQGNNCDWEQKMPKVLNKFTASGGLLQWGLNPLMGLRGLELKITDCKSLVPC